MNIDKTLLLNASSPNSLVIFRERMIIDLVDAGYSVHVSAPNISPDIGSKLELMGAIVHSLPLERTGMSILSDLSYFRSLYRLIGEIQAEIVIGYTIKPNIWGSIAAYLNGVQSNSMVTGLGYVFAPQMSLKSKLVSRLSKFLYKMATKRNDFVVFQNPDDQRDFIATGCLSQPQKSILVNGSGVDIEHFLPTKLPANPRFLMISRLLKSKGVYDYVEAAKLVKAEMPNVTFAIAGSLDKGPDCIEQSELDDWIQCGINYLGQQSDVRDVIADCSIYVLPSYREGTPRTVLEAMAMSRPIITTDAPGCRETVEDGVNGLLVPVKNPSSLAAAMLVLARSEDNRVRMGRESRKKAVEKYSVRKVTDSLLSQLNLI